MSDEHLFGFGKSEIYGCPWHGLVRTNRLTLPNGAHIDGTFSASSARGAVRLAVPGAPAVSRTPEQLAADAVAGYQWRNDAPVMLVSSSSPLLRLYGAGRDTVAQSIYAAGLGNCWAVLLPNSMDVNAARTELVHPATLSAIGRLKLGGVPEEDVRSVTVTLGGYEAFNPYSPMVMLDALPDGSAAILGRAVYSAEQELTVVPFPAAGFALMTVSGAGTDELPLSVNLSLLSAPLASDSDTKIGGAPLPPSTYFFDRRIGPSSDYTAEEDPEDENDVMCPDKRRDLLGATITRTGPVEDLREMELMGFVVGYWFDPSTGAPQAVKTDMRYERRVEIDFEFDVQAVVPAFFFTKYKWNPTLGVCEVQGDLDTFQEPAGMSYRWVGRSSIVTTENIELALIVGGEVSRAALRYEYEWVADYDVEAPTAPGQGERLFPVLPSGVLNQAERLFLNDELVDERVYPVSIAAPGIGPTKMAFDRDNTFASGVAAQWLPGVVQSFHTMGNDRPAAALRLYWLSNHLVGLREIVRGTNGAEITGPVTRNNYGPTAYPGGVNPTEFNSLAMIGTSIRPLYGARSPLTGAMTLGQLDKVVYI